MILGYIACPSLDDASYLSEYLKNAVPLSFPAQPSIQIEHPRGEFPSPDTGKRVVYLTIDFRSDRDFEKAQDVVHFYSNGKLNLKFYGADSDEGTIFCRLECHENEIDSIVSRVTAVVPGTIARLHQLFDQPSKKESIVFQPVYNVIFSFNSEGDAEAAQSAIPEHKFEKLN